MDTAQPDRRHADGDMNDGSNQEAASWLDEASLETDELEVDAFDIVSSPNDWNFTTIVNFIESGAMKIPPFQRNYVWDRKRASKLIESLVIGLPIPQVFLYEAGRNAFHVIDGQQRLLTLYFFAKGRFPKPNIRGALRPFLQEGLHQDEFLYDDDNFEAFRLALPKAPSGQPNRLNGLTYKSLGDDRTSLDLRTIRNIVVKQTQPEGSSAVFEIFSRLNTGAVNLTTQEIRASLFHSKLFDAVLDFNQTDGWRRLVGQPVPDARMRDTEFLLRALALARGLDHFNGSLVGFVNSFCSDARLFDEEQVATAISDLAEFVERFADAPADCFSRAAKFSGVLFEAMFAAWIRLQKPELENEALYRAVTLVKNSDRFASTLQEGSTKSVNVKNRVRAGEDALRNGND